MVIGVSSLSRVGSPVFPQKANHFLPGPPALSSDSEGNGFTRSPSKPYGETTMSKLTANQPDSERSTILHTIASNSDALHDLGERLSNLQRRLYPPLPEAVDAPRVEGGDDVESLVQGQSTKIAQHIETVTLMLNRLT